MNTKTKSFLALLGITSLLGSASAAIIENDFESVTVGTYDGTAGTTFGSATLGNSTGNRNNGAVGATTGVNGSAGFTGQDPAARSFATADMTATTSFSMYFQFVDGGSTDVNNAFVGAGWAVSTTDTDNVSFYSGAPNNRFMIGLGQNGTAGVETKVQFVSMDRFSGETSLGLGEIDLTFGNWYQLSFDLTFNSTDTNWDVADLSLLNWGTDGVTGGSSIASAATVSDLAGFSGINAATDSLGYAVLAGNGDRGGRVLDNLIVIPEPSTLALVGLALGSLLLFRRRKA